MILLSLDLYLISKLHLRFNISLTSNITFVNTITLLKSYIQSRVKRFKKNFVRPTSFMWHYCNVVKGIAG